MSLKEIISKNSVTIIKDMLAVETLRLMIQVEKKASIAPVVDENNVVIGALCAKDIVRSGIVL